MTNTTCTCIACLYKVVNLKELEGVNYSYMHIIYLAGNSLNNKTWIEKVKSKFNLFSTGDILYYDHWKTGDKWINLEAESIKLTNLVNNKKDYNVFAKSIGSVLALKNIFEQKFSPLKAIFCGLPYRMTQESDIPINQYLKALSVPVIFIQNEFDPVYSFAELEKVLQAANSSNYQFIKIPNNNTHDYENFEQLTNLAEDFFVI